MVEILIFSLLIVLVILLLGMLKGRANDSRYEGMTVKYLYNYDGDTVTFDIGGHNVKVRLRNVDTPELNDPVSENKDKAYRAKKYTQVVLKSSRNIRLVNVKGRDKYGRLVARVVFDGKDLGKLLLSRGLASRWIEFYR